LLLTSSDEDAVDDAHAHLARDLGHLMHFAHDDLKEEDEGKHKTKGRINKEKRLVGKSLACPVFVARVLCARVTSLHALD
jgi:hypothetical protein